MLTGMTGTTTRRTGELCGKRFAAYVEPAVITACGHYRLRLLPRVWYFLPKQESPQPLWVPPQVLFR